MRAPSIIYRLSGTVILYNKYILAYYGFPFPIALTMWHMTFSGVLAFLLVRLGYVGVSHRARCAEQVCYLCHLVLSLQASCVNPAISAMICMHRPFLQHVKVMCSPGLCMVPLTGEASSVWPPANLHMEPHAGWLDCRHVT